MKQVNKLQVDMGIMGSRNAETINDIVNQVQMQLAEERLKVQEIVAQASNEFKSLRDQGELQQSGLDQLYRATQMELLQMKEKMAEIEQNQSGQQQAGLEQLYRATQTELTQIKQKMAELGQRGTLGDARGGQGDQKRRGMVILKDLKPSTFNGKPEKWCGWIEEVVDYAEANHRGMRQLLERAEKLKNQEADEYWILSQGDVLPSGSVAEIMEEMFLLLKTGTEVGTQAREIVANTQKKNGFLAWQRLFAHYQPELAAREAHTFNSVLGMMNKKAKNKTEVRGMIVELEGKVRICKEMCGIEVDNNTLRGVLAAMLDPETRIHTSKYLGMDVSFDTLKTEVLKFVNATSGEDDAMVIGAVTETESPGNGAGGADLAGGVLDCSTAGRDRGP